MNNLQIIEHKNQRVLLTQQLAESYGTDRKVISNNYTRNKGRYIEGKHYYLLKGNDLKDFKGCHQIDESLKSTSILYLWTERGAFLHAKSLNTDKAWEVYDSLVEHYFKTKVVQQVKLLSNPMEILKLTYEALNQTNENVAQHEYRIKELEDNKLLNPGEYNYISKAVKNKVKAVMNELNIDYSGKPRSQVYHAIDRDLNTFIGIKTRSQFKAKDFDKALEFIQNWQLSYTDKRIIEQMQLDI